MKQGNFFPSLLFNIAYVSVSIILYFFLILFLTKNFPQHIVSYSPFLTNNKDVNFHSDTFRCVYHEANMKSAQRDLAPRREKEKSFFFFCVLVWGTLKLNLSAVHGKEQTLLYGLFFGVEFFSLFFNRSAKFPAELTAWLAFFFVCVFARKLFMHAKI